MTDKHQLGCCPAMIQAQEIGTDSEAYGAEIYFGHDGEIRIGCKLPPITFCPWCGKKIKRRK